MQSPCFFSCCVFIQMTKLLVNYGLYLSSFIDPLSNRLIQSCYLIKVLLHHSVIPHKLVKVPLLYMFSDTRHQSSNGRVTATSVFVISPEKVYSNLKIVPNQNFYTKSHQLCRNGNISKSFYPYFHRKVQNHKTRTAYATHSYCRSFRIVPFNLVIICLLNQPPITVFSTEPL